jgi:hypothetical protein
MNDTTHHETLEQRANRRRKVATVSVGNGEPPQNWTLITDPKQSAQSLKALWELSCFVFQCPVDKRMDKSVVRCGKGCPH